MPFSNDNQSLILGEHDYHHLLKLLESDDSEVHELLEIALSKADVISGETDFQGVVTLYSTVRFRDLDTLKEETICLVLPHESDVKNKRVSVLTPVGTALIGRRVNQVIRWPVPNNKIRHLEICQVDN